MLRTIVASCVSLFASAASGQVIEPRNFYADSAHYAVPFKMDALFINTYDQPLRYEGASCPNPSDGSVYFEVAANGKPFSDTTVAAGDSINLKCVLISFSRNVGIGCGMNFRTDAGQHVQKGQFGVSGVITKYWVMTSSRENIVYGDVEIGSSKVDSVKLFNIGNGVAHLSAWFGRSEFRLMQEDLIVVNPGDSVTLQVVYKPTKVGGVSDELGYAIPYQSSLPMLFHACTVSGTGVPREKGLTPLEPAITLFAQSFDTPDVDTSRYMCTQSVEVVSARLVHGMRFTIDHVSLPTTITPPLEFNIVVSLRTDSIGLFEDTLLVTTADNETARVLVRGRVIVTYVIDESNPKCRIHPNPTTGHVEWCSEPLDVWFIADAVGIVSATIVADEVGGCRWNSHGTGLYFARSQHTGECISFIVVR